MNEEEILKLKVLHLLKEGIKKFLIERSLSFSIEELNPKIEYSRNEKF